VSAIRHSPSAHCLRHVCVTEYVVSGHRYNIFEDFGPAFTIVITPPAFVLFFAWPVAIGCVSLVYCGGCPLPQLCRCSFVTIHIFYKVRTIIQFRQIITFNRGLNRGRYFRLMALSSIEVLGTIPLGTYIIVRNARKLIPWTSWASVHENYSRVVQVPGFVWKAKPFGIEVARWTPVACAFIFFAFFGFAVEARHHYRVVYRWFVCRFSSSTSSRTLRGSPHAYVVQMYRSRLFDSDHLLFSTSSFGYSKKGQDGIIVSVIAANGDMRDSTLSVTDRLSIPSISFGGDLIMPDFETDQSSLSDSMGSLSSEPREKSPPLEAMTPGVDPDSASDLPLVPDTTHAPIHAYSSDAAIAV